MDVLVAAEKEAKRLGVTVDEVLAKAKRTASGRPPARVHVNARVPAEVAESIKAEAEARGLTQSEVVADRCRRAPAATTTKHVKNARG